MASFSDTAFDSVNAFSVNAFDFGTAPTPPPVEEQRGIRHRGKRYRDTPYRVQQQPRGWPATSFDVPRPPEVMQEEAKPKESTAPSAQDDEEALMAILSNLDL